MKRVKTYRRVWRTSGVAWNSIAKPPSPLHCKHRVAQWVSVEGTLNGKLRICECGAHSTITKPQEALGIEPIWWHTNKKNTAWTDK